MAELELELRVSGFSAMLVTFYCLSSKKKETMGRALDLETGDLGLGLGFASSFIIIRTLAIIFVQLTGFPFLYRLPSSSLCQTAPPFVHS